MTLNLTEIFRSVQGETSLTGLPTTFIRLAACNLRCTWCDTSYSFSRGEPKSIDEILIQVKENGCKHVCVTGGEPLLQSNVHTLMKELCDLGYIVSVETGGSLTTKEIDPRVKVILDLKCPGSGMESKNLWENLEHLKPHEEVKFVIADRIDSDSAKEKSQNLQNVLFSPVHGKLDPKELVEWVLEDQLTVRINLQLHKYIWTPETKGV